MTQCKTDIPDIVNGYNNYFQGILWNEQYPNPDGGAQVNWFNAAALAIRKSFANYPSVLSKLALLGALPKPAPLSSSTINNHRKLATALTTALANLPGWIGPMTAVAVEINAQTDACAAPYRPGLNMLLELKGRLTTVTFPSTALNPKQVCDVALDWIRTFYYWQSTLTVWEQAVYDHCVGGSGSPPSPASVMRVEIPLGMPAPVVTVVQLPAVAATGPVLLKVLQVPPPIWPPWPDA